MARLIDTYRGAVYPWHCDHMGHMNVMWYVGKFDEATWQFFALLGLTPEFLRRNRRGMAAVEQRIAYQRELYAGDVITVGTGALEVRDRLTRPRSRHLPRQGINTCPDLFEAPRQVVAGHSLSLRTPPQAVEPSAAPVLTNVPRD